MFFSLSLPGKLVDVTKNYKYMYFCCGAVVIFASIWLFIGNFINYRLLERERKKAEMYKPAQTEEPEQSRAAAKETEAEAVADGNAQASEALMDKSEDGGAVQRETNI